MDDDDKVTRFIIAFWIVVYIVAGIIKPSLFLIIPLVLLVGGAVLAGFGGGLLLLGGLAYLALLGIYWILKSIFGPAVEPLGRFLKNLIGFTAFKLFKNRLLKDKEMKMIEDQIRQLTDMKWESEESYQEQQEIMDETTKELQKVSQKSYGLAENYRLGQVKKTLLRRQEALSAALECLNKTIEINQSMTTLYESKTTLEKSKIVAKLEKERIDSGEMEEIAKLKMETEKLELQVDHLKVQKKLEQIDKDTEFANLERMTDILAKIKGLENEEKPKRKVRTKEEIIRDAEGKIEIISAIADSFVQVEKAKREHLSKLEDEDEDIKEDVEDMWDNLLKEIKERK